MPLNRGFSGLFMDDNITGLVQEIFIPSAKDLQSAGHANKRRTSRIKEDTLPLDFEVRGTWIDDTANLKFWRDFKAAMLNQVMQPFDYGDNTEFRSVDVLDIAHVRHSGITQPPNSNAEVMVYTAKCRSYEPYSRSKSPALSANQALNNGNGTFTTSFNVSYAGTAPGEPTWQVTLVVPVGVIVTQVKLQNTLTGETCTIGSLSITNGTYIMLIDTCGGGNLGNTPNNSGYGLLGIASLGYGITLSGTGDVDFTGNPPTLAQAAGIPPVATVNPMVATIVANGVLTSAILNYLAPARWIR